MDLRDITMTDFVQLQETWTCNNCMALLKHVQPSYAIVAQAGAPESYYLLEASSLAQLLALTPPDVLLREAIQAEAYTPVPGLASDSEEEDTPDQCVVLEEGDLLGFYDANVDPGSLRGDPTRGDSEEEPAFALSSLVVDAPDTVSLDGVASVLIFLSSESIVSLQHTFPVQLPVGETIDILLRTRQRLVCEEESEGQLTIPESGETLPLQFRLRGVEPGPGKYTVYAFHRRQALGVLYLTLDVSASGMPEISRRSTEPLSFLEAHAPGLPQLTLERQLMGKKAITPPLRPDGSQREPSAPPAGTAPVILWQSCTAEQLVSGLQTGQPASGPASEAPADLVGELSTLLRDLFVETDAIMITPLTPGFSGARILTVQPFVRKSCGGGLFIVKFGRALDIQQEYTNYRQYVFFSNSSGRYTAAFKLVQGTTLGAILYALAGTDVLKTHDFGVMYQQQELSQIQTVLDNIFRSTCKSWYQHTSMLEPLDLTQGYQAQGHAALGDRESRIGATLPNVQFQETLTFHSCRTPSRSLPNPLRVLSALPPFISLTYTAITHGDLNQRNILVDHLNYPWLIDFQSTGRGHILRDVATLDAAIRFQLLATHQATLDEFLVLEETLNTARLFGQLATLPEAPVPENPALTKTYQAVVHLRKLAGWLVRDQERDMREYYIALLYMALETLQYMNLAAEQRERALLSASLLVDLLQLSKG